MPRLGDPAVLHHIDTVGVHNGRQTVGDHNDGLALRQLRKRGLHTFASLSGSAKAVASSRIRMRGIFQHGNGNALLSPAGDTPFEPMTVWMPSGNFR